MQRRLHDAESDRDYLDWIESLKKPPGTPVVDTFDCIPCYLLLQMGFEPTPAAGGRYEHTCGAL